jgi:Peptidase C39 family
MRRTRSPEPPVRVPRQPIVRHRSVSRSRRSASMSGYHDAAYWFHVYNHPGPTRSATTSRLRLCAPQKAASKLGGGISLFPIVGILVLLALIVIVCTAYPIAAPPSVTTAPAAGGVRRISQLDPSQYDAPPFDVNTWWDSACSAAAMTMVINAYGHTYRIVDILREEVRLHEITEASGLLHSSGIDRTVAQFGFRATWLHPGSLDQVIATANNGTPVIANLRGPNFPTGHFQVVKGGTSTHVYTADPSRLSISVWTRQAFLSYYTGLAVVVEPA